MAEVVIKEGSKLCSKDIKDFDIPAEITLAGLVRDGVGMLVKGNTRLQPGDHVVVFCMHGSFHKVEKNSLRNRYEFTLPSYQFSTCARES
ncbi:MAG: hypothetical protein L6U16_03090 [Porphyromonadaceae bacterium]|nr:MAG: hypothetical protein L6U16_03090 [Porphyromonadaceae bacterium]